MRLQPRQAPVARHTGRAHGAAYAIALRKASAAATVTLHATQGSRPPPCMRVRCPSSTEGGGANRQHVVCHPARTRLRCLPRLPVHVREAVLRARRGLRVERVPPSRTPRRRHQRLHRVERLAFLAHAARLADRHRINGVGARRHRALRGRPPRHRVDRRSPVARGWAYRTLPSASAASVAGALRRLDSSRRGPRARRRARSGVRPSWPEGPARSVMGTTVRRKCLNLTCNSIA